VGHIPPGICGRCGYISWMRPSFNEKFVGLLRRHHSVIAAAIFGHEHTDAFHVIYDNNRKSSSVFFAIALLSLCESEVLVCFIVCSLCSCIHIPALVQN